ncbi:MAG: bifunctional 2-polyprenyl-6-hydroxyphenol methylase/3-demethylubiquinol 3-O-methyltransferase UbiG [Methylococcaceae bacterium]|nr:bifunctional 2-polyprenyl-6-hydroxyphenol methylase/3-demethylubiquinol 3-O-methyltransferase UbiG [Methylococcaceae bacterium]
MTDNVYAHEIQKFGSMAELWWDKQGEFWTLHAINPLRLKYIQQFTDINDKRVVDVGCGGGILTEALAQAGANALGIDLSGDLVDVAELHALETKTETVNYQKIAVEKLAEEQPESFDFVTCMEMLEHVPDPGSIISACAKLVKPDGMVFFSTLNRKPKSFLLAIVAAEYVLHMVPKGTHEFKTFIKPHELCQTARTAGLELQGMIGIEYNPIAKRFSLGKNIDVNYIAVFKKQA